MKVAYVVSRFPLVTETFIVRELDAVAREDGMTVELLSLFPASSDTVHSAARSWTERLHRPRLARALGAVAHWTARSPSAVARVMLAVLRDYGRDPDVLWRALVTVVVAADHARTVQRLGVTHVHAHFATYPALAAWVIERLTATPYSVTPHAYDLFVSQLGLRRKLRGARFSVAISQFNRGFLTALGAGSTPVVRYGLDLSTYDFRARAPASDGDVGALMVSSLRDYKGHRVLIEALAVGGPQVDRLRVTFIGDGPLREEIQRVAEAKGVADRLTFLGNRSETEVAEHLSRTDLLIQPSIVTSYGLTEVLPNTLIEAMASGVPVVSTRVSGIPELVRDGETGLLAEPGDAASLHRALEAVLADPVATRARAEAARALVEREYQLPRAARQLVELFAGSTAKIRAS